MIGSRAIIGNLLKTTPDHFASEIKSLEKEAGRRYGGPPPVGSQSYVKIETAKKRFATYKNVRKVFGVPVYDSSPNKLPGEL